MTLFFSFLCKVNIAEQVTMNQREIAFFLAFYLYLLNLTAGNKAHAEFQANTRTSSANFDAKIAVVVHHYTDCEPRTAVLSYTSTTQVHHKNYLRRYIAKGKI